MNDIHPIKPPVETPLIPLLIEVLAVLAIIVLCTWLLLLLRSRRRQQLANKPEAKGPPPDYRQEALQMLAELEEASDEFEIREVFYLLSEIVREYLEKTGDTPLTRMTVAQIKAQYFPKLEQEQQDRLENFLHHCLHGEFSLESHNRLYLKNSFGLARSLISA